MPEWSYSDDELKTYFDDPSARAADEARAAGGAGAAASGGSEPPRAAPPPPPQNGYLGWWHRRVSNGRLADALAVIAPILALILLVTVGVLLWFATLGDDLPSLAELENPQLQFATVAYTADGEELARYARQNRSWTSFQDISPNVINGLIATEDHRFYEHWGIDAIGLMAIFKDAILTGDVRGASTISMQLARNLYNEKIGRDFSVGRKLKEMATAVELEKRYTKQEIAEMYLNTVEFGNNTYGIESGARTYFSKTPAELSAPEAALLVGVLKGTTLYNPFRNPVNAQRRRDQVLYNMLQRGYVEPDVYENVKGQPVETQYRSSAVTASLAPYFAEYVGAWLKDFSDERGIDYQTEGWTVYTTLDSELQKLAQAAVTEQMDGLQAVVDYEWSKRSSYFLGRELAPYIKADAEQPFAYFWESQKDLAERFIKETPRFRRLRSAGTGETEALAELRGNTAFMDSLKAGKTRLEAGLVSLDPTTGHVKVWVGGRDLETDWYDHVSSASRQPGSTFKPFVYTAAIDNGYSPYQTYRDSAYVHMLATGETWQPRNSGSGGSGQFVTLREGLATSLNTVTAQLVMDVGASEVAFYARLLGIESDLDEVPAIALGTSDVTLLELTKAYATLANGGLRNDPVAVTRIEDRNGNVLYEAQPTPREAVSEQTAAVVVDMLRGVVDYGTAVRLQGQFGLGGYDLAGKTGTTQNSADGWLMLMHPDLVTGAWVGFNDRRITFRTNWWGQGAHNALFIVGDFFRAAGNAGLVDRSHRFPTPDDFGTVMPDPTGPGFGETPQRERGRLGW